MNDIITVQEVLSKFIETIEQVAKVSLSNDGKLLDIINVQSDEIKKLQFRIEALETFMESTSEELNKTHGEKS